MLLRSMPANSSIWLHKLAAELSNPALGASVVRYYDIFSFRLLPLVLRSNCSAMLLNNDSSRMKVLLGNIQSQQFPIHFRVLNEFVVVMAQCLCEPMELPEDIWELFTFSRRRTFESSWQRFPLLLPTRHKLAERKEALRVEAQRSIHMCLGYCPA